MPFTQYCIEEGPETLLDLCYKFIVKHLDTIATNNPETGDFVLRRGLCLPTKICEELLQALQYENGFVLDDRILQLFKDTERTRLKKVRLTNTDITEKGLLTVMRHKLSELDVTNCFNLTDESLDAINKNSCNLVCLSNDPVTSQSLVIDDMEVSEVASIYMKQGYIINAPRLQRLTLKCHDAPRESAFFPTLIRPLLELTHLDLSGCEGLGDMCYLLQLKSLHSLVLHDVASVQEAVPNICKITSLRHLDISQLPEADVTFSDEDSTLSLLVESLQELTSLDISGTNLAGTGPDIPGLRSRVGRPLDFLGLFATRHDACRRQNIPAKKISGVCDEAQVVLAAEVYFDRPKVLHEVIVELQELLPRPKKPDINRMRSIVLESMDRYKEELHVQFAGSSNLFFTMCDKVTPVMGPRMKSRLIGSLLNAMEAFIDHEDLLGFGCLTVLQLQLPEDVPVCYRKRLADIASYIVTELEGRDIDQIGSQLHEITSVFL